MKSGHSARPAMRPQREGAGSLMGGRNEATYRGKPGSSAWVRVS
jgi:hypothetical protein